MIARILIITTIIGLLPTYYASANPCSDDMEKLGSDRRPKLETLPPPFHSPEETYVYKIKLPGVPIISTDQYYKIKEQIDRFLSDRQMHHLHASTAMSFDRDSFVMWSSPEIASMIRANFSDSKWVWTGDFKKVSQPIRPAVAAELERRNHLIKNLTEQFYKLLANQDSGTFDFDQFEELYKKAKEEFDTKGLPAGTNLAHFNRTENAELLYSSRRLHAHESIAKSIKGLSENGLLSLSVKSSQYYAALRSLPGLSERIKSEGLRNEIENAMSAAKAMTEDQVAIRVRVETLNGVFGALKDAIRNAEGDTFISELGFKILNRLIEKKHLSELMLEPHAAQIFSNSISGSFFDQYRDGMTGSALRFAPERFKYIQWVLKNKHVDERARVAAQSLLRRAKANGQLASVTLLDREEFEEIYRSLAARVSTVPPKIGLYKHGFFINETYNMESEVSEYLVLADLEATELGIQLVDWTNLEEKSKRLTDLYLKRVR